MQSSDGGWGAFEPENTQYYLNNIPFSDHGALLDPPTADVSGRCLSMLAQLGESALSSEPARRALDYMLKEQEPDGSWYGRWGMNYVYGTWTALCSLNAAGLGPEDPRVKRAAHGCCRSRTRTAAGARTATATSSTTAASNRRRARRRRPRGRCSA
jgi:squalene-hopene/tetraprenyl-beta-curcumene cyclase